MIPTNLKCVLPHPCSLCACLVTEGFRIGCSWVVKLLSTLKMFQYVGNTEAFGNLNGSQGFQTLFSMCLQNPACQSSYIQDSLAWSKTNECLGHVEEVPMHFATQHVGHRLVCLMSIADSCVWQHQFHETPLQLKPASGRVTLSS